MRDSEGFVLAMRGTVRRGDGAAQREWIIATRWGDAGQYLSMSFTGVPAARHTRPPIGLTPVATLLGVRASVPGLCYDLCVALPEGTVLAGRFIVTAGSIILAPESTQLRLRAEADHSDIPGLAPLRVRAVRSAWPAGQFIETSIGTVQ